MRKKIVKILNQAKRELEQLATRKQEIDESKALTLEEYSKSIKKGYEQTHPNHEKKKRDPQSATPDPRESHEAAKKERDETEKHLFRESQDKYHQLNLSNIINEAMLKKCGDESQRK